MATDSITTVGVAGGGVMGAGIAMSFAQAGFRTIVRDVSNDRLKKARAAILRGRFGWEPAIARGKFTREQVDGFLANVTFTTRVADLAPAGLVVEAVPEDEEIKWQVFRELEAVVGCGAIIATNTSGLSIGNLAAAVRRRDRFIGMHWFSPANIMKLVELVSGPDTSAETLRTMEEICCRLGKTCIRVKDAPGTYGFVANRIYFAAVAEARRVVEAGIASAEDVDTAMKLGFNWPSGPLEMFGGARSGWQ
jgi:3-hydroxyacyl-CoA dehydrogenase